ncbi:MAG: T9SS type A sorting domain-containing protein [Bacteroidales bacterium]
MKTDSTIINVNKNHRHSKLSWYILLIVLFCCSANINSQTVESELYNSKNEIFDIKEQEETVYYESNLLTHKENLNISYYTYTFHSQHARLYVSLYTKSFDDNGNAILIDGKEEHLVFENEYSNINKGDDYISNIQLAENCSSYKIVIKARSIDYPEGNNPRIRNIKISAEAALAEFVQVERNSDLIKIKWDRKHPNQKQRFVAELVRTNGSSFNPQLLGDITEDSNTTIKAPSGTTNYKVRINLYGDGENKDLLIASSEDVDATYNSTSQFFMPMSIIRVSNRGRGNFRINVINSSGEITTSKDVLLGDETGATTVITPIKRDGNINNETLLDNEFRINVIALDNESQLNRAPTLTFGDGIYNEDHIAQLVRDLGGVYSDSFELIESLEDEPHINASTKTSVYENDIVEFKFEDKIKHIDLLSPQLASNGGYQAVIRFDAYKNNEGHNPILQFFVADMNNNIISGIESPTVVVDNRTSTGKVVALNIPSSINEPHKIIIRCSVEKKPSANVICTLKKLRISRHDNIATNLQLSSCSNNLNVSWDIANSDTEVNNSYIVELLDESGKLLITQCEKVSTNSTTISLNSSIITSGIYTVRVVTIGSGNSRLGISALKTFTYIKAGDNFDTGSTTSIDYLMLGLEDDGNIGALNKVAQMTTTNTALSVNKVALQMKITSGQYYFVSFPFQPDQVFVNCDEATHRSNILLRSFNSEAYSNTPNSFSASYPVMGDGTSTMPLNEIERGKGYLLSVNKSVTGGTAGNVHVTITGNVSTQTSRYINYNLQELDVQSASVTDEEIGDGYGYKGWNLLANPFPRTFTLENNFYVSVYKIPSASSTSGSDDGKVSAAGYSVYRSTPNDTIPAFVPFFVQSDAATFAMKPRTISSSAASAFSQELRLSLSDGSSFDEVILNLDEEASQFYTIGKDLVKMSSLGSGVPQISSRIGNENLVVRALTNEMAEEGIPVELYIGKSGKQSLSIASSEWNGEYEYIVRNENGEEFTLNNGVYEFEGVAGSTTKVTFIARSMPLGVGDATAQKVVVSQIGDAIEISSSETIENIKLFNFNGALVKSVNPMSETTTIRSIITGAYIVEINTATSREVVKVVIQ